MIQNINHQLIGGKSIKNWLLSLTSESESKEAGINLMALYTLVIAIMALRTLQTVFILHEQQCPPLDHEIYLNHLCTEFKRL